ncbi:MAG: sulfate/molybdate ABC transporter ATP-binding protein [Butyricicoccus sp.]
MLECRFVKHLASFPLEVDLTAGNEAVALLGASGSGKSMALKCIAGVETPDEGRIVLDGKVLFDSAAHVNLPPQARGVGLLFQNYALFPTMTVRQNILCGLRRLPRAEQKARCAELIARFHLDGLENRLPARISGGQQQRAALARMLGSEPRLLLLDEPFSALDSFLRWELEQTVAEVIAAHGGTTLFVSHNRDEAYRLCSRIAVMEQGRIEVCKERQALFAAPETRAAARLIGCENIADIQPPEQGAAFVPAWNVRVPVRGSCPAVGVPAAALVPGEDFSAQVERVMPCPADALVLVRPAGAAETLCWRTDAATAGQLSPGDAVRLRFDPQAVWMLR